MSNAVNLTGYHLTFDQEFTNLTYFNYYFMNTYNNGDTTLKGNGELENYTSDSNINAAGSNYSIQNGELTITAQPTSAGSSSYTSGMLSTGGSFNQNQGYFEIRAEIPSTSGFWPAFWQLAAGPTDYSSENDILEQPNNDGSNNYFTSVKTPTQPSYTEGQFDNAGVSLSQGYHTYGLMWTATTMQFTFDGNYIGPVIATPPALATEKMYLIANLAVGGWAGIPAAGATAQMKIDYIRAYSNNASIPTWWGGDVADGTQAMSSPDGVNTMPNLTGMTTTPTTTTTPPTTTSTTTTITPTTPTVTVVGTGADTLALHVSEDAYNGNAQFTVSVDGTQIGGTQTVTALHSSGTTQEFDVLGNFTTGAHAVTVNFLNDAYGGSASLDRNLYVSSASVDGTTISGSSLTENAGGPQSFSFQKPDTLTLGVSEDVYQGDAQYKVSVDGVDTGSTYIATASHAAGAINTQTISGGWGTGAHTIGITFINDLYGGSTSTDRNLYINSVNYDGDQIGMTTLEQSANGTTTVAVPKTNTLTLGLSEDAYNGDAQFSVIVDGKAVIPATSVTASHAAGASQAFSLETGLTAGTHDIAVSFLNDSYGGSASTDRNLYVNGAQLNGTALNSSTWTAAIDTTSTQHFSLVVPS